MVLYYTTTMVPGDADEAQGPQEGQVVARGPARGVAWRSEVAVKCSVVQCGVVQQGAGECSTRRQAAAGGDHRSATTEAIQTATSKVFQDRNEDFCVV